jgi:hypothetical protein
LANIVGLGQPGVFFDCNQLGSSDLRNVQIRGGPPAAAAISHLHDDGYLHGFNSSDLSKWVATNMELGLEKIRFESTITQQLRESFQVAGSEASQSGQPNSTVARSTPA